MRNDLQAAIDTLEELKGMAYSISTNRYADQTEAMRQRLYAKTFDTALTVLCDALRRQDGCDVCNHDGFDEMVCYIPTENGDGLMVISNYCPNCGCEISKQAIKYGAGYVDQDILRSAT